MPLSLADVNNDADTEMIKSLSPTLSYFSKALAAFLSSGSPFKIVCSLPGRTSHASSTPGQDLLLEPIPPACSIPSLVVLDSSFNPPTMAHMRMARSALAASSPPRRILLLLAVNNADKEPKPAPFDHRLVMMSGFAKDLQDSQIGETRFQDVTVDVALTTQPYFSSKAIAVSESCFYDGPQSGSPMGSTSAMEQVYLAGFDTLVRIFSPKYYPMRLDTAQSLAPMQAALDPFFDRSRLRITHRPDDKWGGLAEQQEFLDNLAKGELDKVGGRSSWAEKVELVEGRKPDEEPVSSTRVRSVCASDDTEPLKWLVSPAVREWIVNERLYGLQESQG